MRLGASVIHHQMKCRTGVIGEALGEQGLDAFRERAGQFFDFVGADADGGVEAVLWRKKIGEHIGLGDSGVAGRLVGVVTAHIEVQRCVGRVVGEGCGAFTRTMRRVVELHKAVERGGKVEIGSNGDVIWSAGTCFRFAVP